LSAEQQDYRDDDSCRNLYFMTEKPFVRGTTGLP
jgi:hypothetical protein